MNIWMKQRLSIGIPYKHTYNYAHMYNVCGWLILWHKCSRKMVVTETDFQCVYQCMQCMKIYSTHRMPYEKVEWNSNRPVCFRWFDLCPFSNFIGFGAVFGPFCCRFLYVTLYLIMIFIVSVCDVHSEILKTSAKLSTYPFRIDDILNWLFYIQILIRDEKKKSCHDAHVWHMEGMKKSVRVFG